MTTTEVLAWLRAHPEAALEVAQQLQPVGDWEARVVSKRQEQQLVRKNSLGHVVAQVGPSWGRDDFPGQAYVAWMTYPLRAPHGLYRSTVSECLQAADAELQENPKCLVVNPRSPA